MDYKRTRSNKLKKNTAYWLVSAKSLSMKAHISLSPFKKKKTCVVDDIPYSAARSASRSRAVTENPISGKTVHNI